MRKDVALYNERILRSNLKNRNRGKNKVTVEACLKDANEHNDNRYQSRLRIGSYRSVLRHVCAAFSHGFVDVVVVVTSVVVISLVVFVVEMMVGLF